eukprot:CAMPEP_0197657934 /NCGR_PEP_ID=MMETSP1338-20131121/44931_1 /TAXON_ID=43686 ORGANISM="Pelagodinium beii, Strain RCC1491" /NCGR_SAMPLE_ID=MMETSP1338 /ASSEMBLY_ACC=CAM_ASM_000754 /LENGTH=64 /DNA_ID=CAMNT_0043234415 /DNA_START=308 /DNA_END=501 /DNA_ORIENTATION=+
MAAQCSLTIRPAEPRLFAQDLSKQSEAFLKLAMQSWAAFLELNMLRMELEAVAPNNPGTSGMIL